MSEDWISAAEAQRRLGVRPQTLYAYVSRGRVRARPDPADPRRSLYRAADVAALQTRRLRSRKPAEIAAGAIAWGEPVLSSAITAVSGGRLFYRGRDAVALAENEGLEAVARLLRGGQGAASDCRPAADPLPTTGDFQARAFAVLAARASADRPMLGRSPVAVAAEADRLLDGMADAAVGARGEGPIAARLATAWGLDPVGPGGDLIRRALVLLADHELNASTFAVRVSASTGAALAACVLAGLATLSGPRHGGAAAAARGLAAEARRSSPAAAIAARLAEDRALPGFGHPLYPEGDPRAAALLARTTVPSDLRRLARDAEEVTGLPPNVDFALLAMAETLHLPEEAPFVLFAVGRCAGWIAHAIEQERTGELIRPRARYVGIEV